MKKVSILLISVLFALAVSCSNPTTNPDNTNTEDGTQNGITLAERAGTYSGTMEKIGSLEIVLDAQAQVTSIKINGTESLDSSNNPLSIKEGADYTGTTIAPFDATVNMYSYKSTATVSIEFKSQTDKTAGATAEVTIMNNPNTVELIYAAPAAN